ncbi:hypothetical protein CKO36_12870 [Rhabdochromatium marinum]|nr:hypothetical protein [Rhabdochromatium marinum]
MATTLSAFSSARPNRRRSRLPHAPVNRARRLMPWMLRLPPCAGKICRCQRPAKAARLAMPLFRNPNARCGGWRGQWSLTGLVGLGLSLVLAGCSETMATNTGTAASVAGLHAVPPRLVATTAPGIEAAEAGYSGQPPVAPLSLEADEPLPWPPANVELPLLQEAASATQMYQWSGDGRPLSRIVIDTDRQQARFYSGDEQVGWTTVATGVDSHPTPSGEFAVLEKVANKRSNLYGRIYDRAGNLVKANAQRGRDAIPPGGRFVGAQMPHFLRLTNDGVGIHAGPIPLPGSPASHGCIRMPAEVAAQLYRQVAPGTRVTVVEGKSGRRD